MPPMTTAPNAQRIFRMTENSTKPAQNAMSLFRPDNFCAHSFTAIPALTSALVSGYIVAAPTETMSEESTAALRAECDPRLAFSCACPTHRPSLRPRPEGIRTVCHIRFPMTFALRCEPLRASRRYWSRTTRDKIDADGKRCIEILSSGAHKASLLIDDLLTYSRLFPETRLDQDRCQHERISLAKN